MDGALTSRERLLRAARGGSVDRVPISPPIGFSPVEWDEHWANAGAPPDPLWHEVAKLCRKHCDCLVQIPGPVHQLFDRRFLLTPPGYIEQLPPTQEGEWQAVRHIIHTPKGDLTTTDRDQPGIATSWYTEPLVKTAEDAEALLSVPYEFRPPDLAPSLAYMQKVGDRGLTEINVSTPMVSVSRLMHFDQFLLWCRTERALVHRLLSTMAERVALGLEHAVKAGLGPVMWLGGSEQATPPMMGPTMYDEFVVRYDGPLIDLVHAHGGLVHVHCHGRIGGIVDRLLDMGVDMLDPVEPPPDGDVTMAEARAAVGARLTLLGNIEFRELEFSSPRRIEHLVRTAIAEGGPERMILYPSAGPIAKLTPQYRDNALAYIEAGLRYGG
jgi:Uroporphyrinogen decarboxylase (URO-D)